MPWNIFQVCVTRIREGIWEMRLRLFAEKDKYCYLSRWHIATWVYWCLEPVTAWLWLAELCWVLSLPDRIPRLHRKALVRSRKILEVAEAWLWFLLYPAGLTLSSFADHIGTSFGRDFTYPFHSFTCLASFLFRFLLRQRKSSNNPYHSSQAQSEGPEPSIQPAPQTVLTGSIHLRTILGMNA